MARYRRYSDNIIINQYCHSNLLICKYGEMVFHPFMDYTKHVEKTWTTNSFAEYLKSEYGEDLPEENDKKLARFEQFINESILSNVFENFNSNTVILVYKPSYSFFYDQNFHLQKMSYYVPNALAGSPVVWMVKLNDQKFLNKNQIKEHLMLSNNNEEEDDVDVLFANYRDFVSQNIDSIIDNQYDKNKALFFFKSENKFNRYGRDNIVTQYCNIPFSMDNFFNKSYPANFPISGKIQQVKQKGTTGSTLPATINLYLSSRPSPHSTAEGLANFNELFLEQMLTNDYAKIRSTLAKKIKDEKERIKKEKLEFKKTTGKSVREFNKIFKEEIVKKKKETLSVVELQREAKMATDLSLVLNSVIDACTSMQDYLSNVDNHLRTRGYERKIQDLRHMIRTIDNMKKS